MMRRIEIELEGVTVTARLLDHKAPKVCQAFWDALPLEDDVAHAQWSGAMFHTVQNDWFDFEVDYPWGLENKSGYQAPGDVVYFPPSQEIAIAYGDAQFCWVTGNLIVSTIAQIEDDLTELAKRAERLQWEGSKQLIVRRKQEEA
jgi:hypothetical protein